MKMAVFVTFLFLTVAQNAIADEPNFPICRYSSEQSWPSVSGNYVVWQDKRNSNQYDIYRNNPDNMSYTDGISICTVSPGHQKVPVVSGNIVVWQDGRTTNSHIYRYQLPSGPNTVVSTDPSKEENPSISGNTIVWQDSRNGVGNWDIYGYTIGATEFAICTASNDQQKPSIDGNIVVWQDLRNGNNDIYGANLTPSLNVFPICTDANTQQNAAVSGNFVVWEDYRNLATEADIYGKNLATGEEFIICNAAGQQIYPAIDGDIVVWEDQRNGSSDIYGYRISSQTTFPISTLASNQKNPAISGNFVVWEDWRNSNADIYGAYLPQPVVLTILSPNGGETLIAGKQCTITWQSSGGTLDFVKLEYSINGGQDFTVITPSTANNGSFSWLTPTDIDSNQCLVKVSDMSVSGSSDTSNAAFTIFQCDAALTADLSGDCKVNFTDFAILSSQWLECGNLRDPDWCQ